MNEETQNSDLDSESSAGQEPVLISSRVNAFLPADNKPEGVTNLLTIDSSGLIGRLVLKESSMEVALIALGTVVLTPFMNSYKNFHIQGTEIRVMLTYDEISHVSMSTLGNIVLHVRDPQNVIGFGFNSPDTAQIINILKNKNIQFDPGFNSASGIARRRYLLNWIFRIASYAIVLGFIGFILFILKRDGAI